MNQRGLTLTALIAAFAMASSLVMPWLHVSGRDRSTIELVTDASVLGVIEGARLAMVVALWLLIPVLVASGLIAFASGRSHTAMLMVVGAAAGLLLMAGAAATAPATQVAWGLLVGAACAVVALGCAMMVLVRTTSTKVGPSDG